MNSGLLSQHCNDQLIIRYIGMFETASHKNYINCSEYSQFIMYCIYIKMQKFIKMIYIILEDEITEKTKEAFILLNISLSQVCSPVLLTKTKTKTIKQCFIEIKLKKIDE